MIAIIPARGGSKGLPGKNIRLLGGRPLICHSISAALDSKSISRVIVSTDDTNIAEIAKECGAEVPFIRPKELADDTSMVMDAYLHLIDKLSVEGREKVESFVALLPTAPLRTSEDIDNAIEIFTKYEADSVMSVTETAIPIEWYMKITDSGILSNYLAEKSLINNRQDFNQAYNPNGAIYVFRTEILRRTRQYISNKTYAYVMPRDRSADIDDLFDFEWAEFLIQRMDS